MRVHPEFLAGQKVPPALVGKDIWEERFEDINAFERYVTRNGIAIRKFFLHVSRKEQKKRFLERLDQPEKNWKFSLGGRARARALGRVHGGLRGRDPPYRLRPRPLVRGPRRTRSGSPGSWWRPRSSTPSRAWTSTTRRWTSSSARSWRWRGRCWRRKGTGAGRRRGKGKKDGAKRGQARGARSAGMSFRGTARGRLASAGFQLLLVAFSAVRAIGDEEGVTRTCRGSGRSSARSGRAKSEPYEAGWLERKLLGVEKAERPPVTELNLFGLYPRIQGIAQGSRNGLGVRFWQPDIDGSRISATGSAFATVNKYQYYDFILGRIAHGPEGGFPERTVKTDDVFELGQIYVRPGSQTFTVAGFVRSRTTRSSTTTASGTTPSRRARRTTGRKTPPPGSTWAGASAGSCSRRGRASWRPRPLRHPRRHPVHRGGLRRRDRARPRGRPGLLVVRSPRRRGTRGTCPSTRSAASSWGSSSLATRTADRTPSRSADSARTRGGTSRWARPSAFSRCALSTATRTPTQARASPSTSRSSWEAATPCAASRASGSGGRTACSSRPSTGGSPRPPSSSRVRGRGTGGGEHRRHLPLGAQDELRRGAPDQDLAGGDDPDGPRVVGGRHALPLPLQPGMVRRRRGRALARPGAPRSCSCPRPRRAEVPLRRPRARGPDDRPIPKPGPIELATAYDVIEHTFSHHPKGTIPPAANVNTLGEVPDSSWFTNRIGARGDDARRDRAGAEHGRRPREALEGRAGQVLGHHSRLHHRGRDGRDVLLQVRPRPVPAAQHLGGGDGHEVLPRHGLQRARDLPRHFPPEGHERRRRAHASAADP